MEKLEPSSELLLYNQTKIDSVFIEKLEYQKIVEGLISDLYGNSLLLFPKENLPTQIPPAVTEIIEWPHVPTDSKFDAILSIGNLASESDLPQFLLELGQYLTPESKFYFCERTKIPNGYNGSAKYDISGTLWANEWSVIRCERFRLGKSKRSPSYVTGIARMKRSRDHNL
tara:strand:+ start:1057 stop:1569 length:513 start_codon:yes stop_codon:yes gene_type:complete